MKSGSLKTIGKKYSHKGVTSGSVPGKQRHFPVCGSQLPPFLHGQGFEQSGPQFPSENSYY